MTTSEAGRKTRLRGLCCAWQQALSPARTAAAQPPARKSAKKKKSVAKSCAHFVCAAHSPSTMVSGAYRHAACLCHASTVLARRLCVRKFHCAAPFRDCVGAGQLQHRRSPSRAPCAPPVRASSARAWHAAAPQNGEEAVEFLLRLCAPGATSPVLSLLPPRPPPVPLRAVGVPAEPLVPVHFAHPEHERGWPQECVRAHPAPPPPPPPPEPKPTARASRRRAATAAASPPAPPRLPARRGPVCDDCDPRHWPAHQQHRAEEGGGGPEQARGCVALAAAALAHARRVRRESVCSCALRAAFYAPPPLLSPCALLRPRAPSAATRRRADGRRD